MYDTEPLNVVSKKIYFATTPKKQVKFEITLRFQAKALNSKENPTNNGKERIVPGRLSNVSPLT